MTKRDFIEAQAKATKDLNKRMVIWLGLFLLGMIGLVPVVNHLDSRPDEFGWIARISGGLFLLFLLSGLALLGWFGARQQAKLPKCPNCGKPLQHMNAKIAIACGNCAECGGKIFPD